MNEIAQRLTLFFQSVADIAAMRIVEDIFHNQEASNFAAEEDDHAESDYHAREVEHLEDILEKTDYSYVGINTIIYLYKDDDVIADLDTDDYSWKRADEGINPIAAANALIDAIADTVTQRLEKWRSQANGEHT